MTLWTFSAACFKINLPTRVDPVIDIFFIISEEINSEETWAGSPDNKFTTPGGTPDSLHISTNSITVPGVITSGKRLWFVSPYILFVSSEFHSNISAAPPISPAPSERGFPTSRVIHFDNTSTFFLINSEIFLIIFALSQGDVSLQIFKPFSADLRAFCISSLFAFEALPIISSVAGLITS